ncbi:hypothetical protein FQN52_003619 [Onygenales sp. PD_12]|nr:hypothetical protein FQN52_003619 [Onygenales sp. PD_12]
MSSSTTPLPTSTPNPNTNTNTNTTHPNDNNNPTAPSPHSHSTRLRSTTPSTSTTADLEGTTLDGGSRDDGRIPAPFPDHSRPPRRHRNRTSSSFLLESGSAGGLGGGVRGSAPGSRPSPYPVRTPETQRAAKGKGKRGSEEPEVVVSKRAAAGGYRRDGSLGVGVGSSPLGRSVASASPGGADASASASQQGQRPVPSVGFDTDPAQIVNLALNLSESRRRNVSGRVVSGNVTVARGPRVVSGHGAPVGDAYRFPSQDGEGGRHSPRVSSQLAPASTSTSTAAVARHGSVGRNQPLRQNVERSPASPMANMSSMQYEYIPFEVSSATLARADKARKHFELFAEYLRLLPHLPPLPNPVENGGAAGASSVSDRGAALGRVYNPLQYIRNRKVRYREKCAIDSEADGWENVEKVQNWVDLVVNADEGSRHEPDQCILLPKIEPDMRIEEWSKAVPQTPNNNTRIHSGADSGKPRRPRMDWVTSPADLLADSAWLEEESNKLKIEDRDGNRLYPPNTLLKKVPLKGSEPPPPEIISTEVLNTIHGEGFPLPEHLPTFHPATPRHHASSSRGHRKHKLVSSIHPSPSEHSSANGSKSRWRRTLSRSSESSSDSSSDEHEGWHHRGRRRFTRLSRKTTESDNLGISTQKISDVKSRTPQNSSSPAVVTHPADVKSESARPPILPPLDTNTSRQRPVSLPRNHYRFPSSSKSERKKEDIPHPSHAAADDSRPTSPSRPIPDITFNLSPPSSRAPSPSKSPISRLIDSRRRLGSSKESNSDVAGKYMLDQSTPDLTPHKRLVGIDSPAFSSDTKLASYGDDKGRNNGPSHPESPAKGYKSQSHQESKLRGIFKSGRIAEIVGSEVSKVGDYIRKKDSQGHSRQSSSASSILSSEYADADDEDVETKRRQKSYGARLPTSLSETNSLVRKDTRKESSKYHPPNLPTFTSPFKQGEILQACETNARATASQPQLGESSVNANDSHLLTPIPTRSDVDGYTSGLELMDTRVDENLYRQVSRDRPPVTGLTNLTVSATQPRRPTLSEATRNWSMSSRSIGGIYPVDQREIARVRAHLLSSGIKAQEICRQAQLIRDSPPILMVAKPDTSPGADTMPRVPRSEEVSTAARTLMTQFDHQVTAIQHSLSTFSSSTSPSLKSQLDQLDALVNTTLTPRIRAVTMEADKLTSDLATTNTLKLKQLHASLDQGIRKRKRRFRWVSRVGFVLLEWAVVGAMWWVWLVVMMWKVVRGVWRGGVGGVRWILWL